MHRLAFYMKPQRHRFPAVTIVTLAYSCVWFVSRRPSRGEGLFYVLGLRFCEARRQMGLFYVLGPATSSEADLHSYPPHSHRSRNNVQVCSEVFRKRGTVQQVCKQVTREQWKQRKRANLKVGVDTVRWTHQDVGPTNNLKINVLENVGVYRLMRLVPSESIT